MHKAVCLLLGAVVSLVLFTACSGQSEPGERIVTQQCTSCHARLIMCTNLERGPQYWEETVDRMARKGMDLTEQDKREATEYLSGLQPGADVLCD